MIYNIPIEPLQERYSEQWDRWFESNFYNMNVSYKTIKGKKVSSVIKHGSFLDVVDTNIYKLSQLQQICELMDRVKDGDIFFFHDLWFPGLEVLAYIRDGLKKKIKIYGCLHAGTYDDFDFLNKQGMSGWGEHIENGWFTIVDGIFVATKFHKQLISSKRLVDEGKIIVTGFPIYSSDFLRHREKERLVVFPHRLDNEKCPELFDKLKSRLRHLDVNFIKTKDVCATKQAYYDVLASASIAVSFAQQETWGIAMQESMFLSCVPLVPDRLSYSEMYYAPLRYDTFADLQFKITAYFTDGAYKLHLHEIMEVNKMNLRKKGMTAIVNMVTHMKNWR